MQIPAIKTAKDMGFQVIASDRDPNAEGFRFVDHPLVIDTKDVKSHVEFAKANKLKLNIIGAFAGADVAVTVAAITNALGLPGIPLQVAIASNNKAIMKKKWLADKVSTPLSIEVKDIKDAKTALERTGLPAMVKAIDSAASRGSKKIISESELEDALEDAKKHSSTNTAIIEEFVEGNEYSVETIVYKGNHYHFGIVDRHFGFAPYAIEIGHTNPTNLPSDIQEQMYNIVKKAATSLGIEFGPAKADMILTKKGPMILEMTSRLSGGWHSQYTTPLATGLDPIRVALNLATGGKIKKEDTIPRYNRVSMCKAIFPKPGQIIKIDGVDEAKRIKGVAQVILVVKEGDIIPPYKNCAHRVCYIITVADTREAAEKSWVKASETIRILTR